MRLLSAVLFVALTGSLGFAEEPAPPPAPTDEAKPPEAKPRAARTRVPLRVVKLLPETRQVLLFDKTQGTHVVAEVGQDVDGYLVDEISDDDVTLVAQNGTEVILAAPEPTWRRRQADRKTAATGAPVKADPAATAVNADPASKADPATVKADLAPEDPYAEASPIAPIGGPIAAPIIPGADGVRVADATKPAATTPGADGVRVASADAPAEAPGVAAFMAAVADDDIGENGNPTAAAAPTPTPAAAVPPTTTVAGPTTATVQRADINAAVANFAQTSSTFRASFTKDGLRFDDVTKGSLLARVGLERGDVVTTVDGQPLRSLDDAANLYARLPTARGTTLQVLRSGKPVTLRVSIQ
jgi:membrane-associated protease RseP (regulator of RpoE activity)